MLLHQVALVLRLQVASPVARELKLAARSFQNLDALGVVEPLEIVVQHEFQPFDQLLVPHLAHEFQILAAVLQRIADQVFEELLGQLHVVLQLVEGHLRLDHPELREVARRVGILGTERGAEGVDAPQRQRAQLAFELSRYGQVAGFAEKILRIVDPPVLGAGRIVQIERRHLEHGARTLAVGGRDERRVPVVEAAVVEELVDGEGHGVTDAQHRAERIGTRTQVGDVAQEFERMALFLQRIGRRVGRAVNLDRRGLHLDALALAGRLHEPAVDTDAGARGDLTHRLVVELRQLDDHLNARHARTVVQGDEGDVLVAALGTHPPLDGHIAIDRIRLDQFYDS